MSNAPNPGARLGWRIRHSWWLLLPILGLGCLGGAGFLYIGLRARRPSWWIPGIVYMLLAWTGFALVGQGPEKSSTSDWATGLWFAVWVATVVHAGIINSAWLQWRAYYTPWYAEPTAPPPSWQGPAAAPPPAFPATSAPLPPAMQPQPGAYYAPAPPATFGPPPVFGPPPGSGPPPVFGPPPVAGVRPVSGPPAAYGPPPLMDVNTATAEDLARLPGFDPDRAHRTVAERRSRSGFASVEEFAFAAGLAPHQFAPLRARLTCSPPAPPPPPQGRVLDV